MEIERKSAARGLGVLNTLIAILALAVMLELVYNWEGAISIERTGGAPVGNPGAAPAKVDLRGRGPDYQAYLTAPVLDRDRTPLRISTPGSKTAAGSALSDIELIGTVIAKDGRWAHFKLPGQQGLLRAGPGETVAGWTVNTINPYRVTIERSGRIETLELPGGTE